MNSKANASASSQNRVNRQTTPAFRSSKSNDEKQDQHNNNNNDTSKNQGPSVQSQIEKYQANANTDKPSGPVTSNTTTTTIKKTNSPATTINQRTESAPNLKYVHRPTSDPAASSKAPSNPPGTAQNGTSMLRSNSNDHLNTNTSTNKNAPGISRINSDTGATKVEFGKSNNVRATIDTSSLHTSLDVRATVQALKTSFEDPPSKTSSSPAKPPVKSTQPEPSKAQPVVQKSSQADPPKTLSFKVTLAEPAKSVVVKSQPEPSKTQPVAVKATQQSQTKPFTASKSVDLPSSQESSKPQPFVALKSTQSDPKQASSVKSSQPAEIPPSKSTNPPSSTSQPDLVKPSTLKQTASPVKTAQEPFYKPNAYKTESPAQKNEPPKSNPIAKSPSAPVESFNKSTTSQPKQSEAPKQPFYTQNVKTPSVAKLFPTAKQDSETQQSSSSGTSHEPADDAPAAPAERLSSCAEAEPASVESEFIKEEPEAERVQPEVECAQPESTPVEPEPTPNPEPVSTEPTESPRSTTSSPREYNNTPELPPDDSDSPPTLPPSPMGSPSTPRKKPQRPSRSATMIELSSYSSNQSQSSSPFALFDSRDSQENSDSSPTDRQPTENTKANDAKLHTIRRWMREIKKQNRSPNSGNTVNNRRKDLRIARQLSEVEIKKLEGQLNAQLVLVVLPPLENQNVNIKKISGFCKLQITMSQETSHVYKSAYHFQKLHQKIEECFPDIVKEQSLALPKYVREGKMEYLFDPQGRKDLQVYVDLVVAQTAVINHPLFEDFLDPSIMPVLISTAEGDREGILRVSTGPLRWHERWGVIKWKHFYVYKDQDDIGSTPSLAIDLQTQIVTVDPGVSGTVSNSSKEQTVFDVTLWSEDKTYTYKGKDEKDRNQWILTLRAVKSQRPPGSYDKLHDSLLDQSYISRLLFDYAANDSSYGTLKLNPYHIDDEPIPSDQDSNSNFIYQAQKQQIKGGTVDKLIEKLCDNQQGMDFVHTFLLTYRSFTTPQNLLVACIKRFHSQTSGTELPMHPTQLRVCTVLSKWVSDSFNDFCEDDSLTGLLIYFIEVDLLQNTKFIALGKKLKDAVKKKVFKQRNLSLIGLEFPDPELPILFNHAPEAWDFVDIAPVELARQFTLIEFDLFKKIQPKECLKIKDKEKHAPNILAVIKRFNKMSSWVVTQIVKAEDFKTRVALVSRFIELAHHCILMNNYNTGMEIMSAFNASPIFRLQKTWDGLSGSIANMLNSMKQLLGSANNYKVYREKLHTIQPPCVPYFGVYLTDLTFVEEGNLDKLDNGLINFEKNFLFYKVIKEIKLYQQTPYVFKPIEPIKQYFSKVDDLGPVLDENEAYNLSLKIEPRDSSS